MEANVRRTSAYRSYNPNVPDWLREKPLKFTKHCLEKIGIVKENETKVTQRDGEKCLIRHSERKIDM